MKPTDPDNPLVKKLSKYVTYDKVTGSIRNIKNNRPYFADDQGYITVWITEDKKLLKVKANKVAVYLGSGRFINASERILHKNLDSEDFSLGNLLVVNHELYNKIREALFNLNSDLKIVPHAWDQFVYWVVWKEDNDDKRILCQDIIQAQNKLKEMQLYFSKILTKYCLT